MRFCSPVLFLGLFICLIFHKQSNAQDAVTQWADSCINSSFIGTVNIGPLKGFSYFTTARAYIGDDIIVAGTISPRQSTNGWKSIFGILMRVSKTGEVKWSKFIGEHNSTFECRTDIYAMTIAKNGDIVVTAQVFAPVSPIEKGIFIVRFDAEGNALSKQRFNGYTSLTVITNMIETSDGGFLLHGSQDGGNSFLIKIDNQGILQWKRAYYLDILLHCTAVCETPNGYYFVGYSIGQNSERNLLVKVNKADGAVIWARSFDERNEQQNNMEFTYHWLEYNNGVFQLSGNTNTHYPNPNRTTQSTLTLTEDGQFIKGKRFTAPMAARRLDAFTPRRQYYSFSTNAGIQFDYDHTNYDFYLFRLDDEYKPKWANRIPLPGYNKASVLAPLRDSSFLIAGTSTLPLPNANIEEKALLIKTTIGGKVGNCSTPYTNVAVSDIQTSTSLKTIQAEPVQKNPTFVSQIPVQDGFGYTWDLECTGKGVCKLSKIIGDPIVCTGTKVFYKVRKDGTCNTPVRFRLSDPTIPVEIVNDTTIAITLQKSATTTLYASMETDCKVLMDSMTITSLSSPGQINLGPDKAICDQNTIILKPQADYITYSWQDGSTKPTLTINLPGIYHVKVVDACNNVFADTIEIVKHAPINFSLGNDQTKCINDTLLLNAPDGFMNYSWAPDYKISAVNSQKVAIYSLIDTTYFVKAEKEAGCFVFDTIRVAQFKTPTIQLGNDTSICYNSFQRLDAGDSFSGYQWNTGETLQQISVNKVGVYTVTATTNEGCKIKDTLAIQAVWKPVIQFDKSPELCEDAIRTLNPGTFARYLWHDGSTLNHFNASKPGTYFVEVHDSHNCMARDTVRITTVLSKPVKFLPSDTTICSYSTLDLQPSLSFVSYAWNDGSSRSTLSINQPGKYWLEVKDTKGCIGSDTILISHKTCPVGLYIPTAFTPNADGKNDVFKPTVLGPLKNFSLVIYNRWGQVVFHSSDPNKGWNGKFERTEQDMGVYVWICQYEFATANKKVIQKGSLTLIK